MAVVAFADDCVGQRVENPRPPHAGSLVKISRVLFKKRRQDGAADERAGHGVGVRCAEAFSVALGALPVSAERVRSLLNSGDGCSHAEVHGIYGELPRELKFLPRVERHSSRIVSHIKIRNDAEDPLLFFILDFGFGHFDRGHRNADLARRSGYCHLDGRHTEVFSRMQGSGKCLHGETGRSNRELERSRRNADKIELTVAVGSRLLIEGRILARNLYERSRNHRSHSIHNASANGSRPDRLLVRGCPWSRNVRSLLGLREGGIGKKQEQARAQPQYSAISKDRLLGGAARRIPVAPWSSRVHDDLRLAYAASLFPSRALDCSLPLSYLRRRLCKVPANQLITNCAGRAFPSSMTLPA